MKKAALIIVLCLILNLTACTNEISYHEYVKTFSGLDISGSTIVSGEDSHGGFLGDGALMVEFDCTQISDALTSKMSGWNPMPLSENLNLVMYGGTKDGTVYAHELAEKYGIPEIKNGYYYFVDRHAKSTDPSSDAALFSQLSYNFTLVIYNSDNAHLYLFEFDT